MVLAASITALILAYLVGSIPSGLIIVKLINGKDLRQVESGRTGGTNALRAAGLIAGLLTAGMDVLKGVASGWIVQLLQPGDTWLQVLAAVMAIIGHNYSVFLQERGNDGKVRFRGGAGGATALGGAIALWTQSWVIILPIGALVFLLIGYASVTTISVAVIATGIFIYRAAVGASPAEYIVYGVLALIIVLYALRPNLERLAQGTERMVGLRAYIRSKQRKI